MAFLGAVIPAFDHHDTLVQMPNVAGSKLSATQSACDGWTKPHQPSSDDLAPDIDPAFQWHLFNIPEIKTEIEPDRMSDDGWRKPMMLVIDRL